MFYIRREAAFSILQYSADVARDPSIRHIIDLSVGDIMAVECVLRGFIIVGIVCLATVGNQNVTYTMFLYFLIWRGKA